MMRILAGACLGPVLLFAAQNAQAPATTPLYRSTTQLVQVSVIVRDKSGPVADLTKADFTLLDSGKPQDIKFFSVSRAAPAGSATPAPAPLANVFTNRPAEGPASGSTATVILLDAINSQHSDQLVARTQILKFLSTQLQPEDKVALYLLGNRFQVLQDFTSDSQRLLQALDRFRGASSHQLAAQQESDSAALDEVGDELKMSLQAAADFYTVDRTLRTLSVLESIAKHLKYLTGRKNLVWLSSGFPLTMGFDDWSNPRREVRTFDQETQRAVRALNDANVAVYPVDVRGLVTDPRFSAALPGRVGQSNLPPVSLRNLGLNDAMLEIAERTGGKAAYNTNDLARAVRSAIDDASVTYTLAYYPSEEPDDRFHPIKVQVNRKGVHASFRKGYYSFVHREASDKEKNAEIQSAAWSPLMASGIGGAIRFFPPVNQGRLHILALAEPYDLTWNTVQMNNSKELRWETKFDYLRLQRDRNGKTLAAERRTIGVSLPRERYLEIMKNGIRIDEDVELKPGAAEMRVVFRDNASGNVGSLIAPLGDAISGPPPSK